MSTSASIKLIAIVGGSGAGKGWLVARLRERLGERACHLQLDNFYRDRSHLPIIERAELNFDIPDAIDWDEAERVLRDCRAGRPARMPHYDFATYSRVAEREQPEWQPRPIVLVDGLWLLVPPVIRALFDLKIYVDAPAELRCARRLARDIAERGYTADLVERQLRIAVLPMHDCHVEPQKKWADIVLRHPIDDLQITALAERIARCAGVPPGSVEKPAEPPALPRSLVTATA
jgi:uridine kinase